MESFHTTHNGQYHATSIRATQTTFLQHGLDLLLKCSFNKTQSNDHQTCNPAKNALLQPHLIIAEDDFLLTIQTSEVCMLQYTSMDL
jgi:hypothetical protein